VLERYPRAEDVVWLQEEPANMGAWPFVAPRLRSLVGNRQVRYVGRPERASPAEGWAEAHRAEQLRIISEVLEGVPSHAH
jgi:2-oxoglutarate dehydrogenase E1 component